MFVSHGGMNDRGSTCKFRNARNKQVEFIPYIYTLSKLSRFDYGMLVFNTQQGGIQNNRRRSRCKIEFWPHWISTRGVLIQRAAIKIQRIFHVELRPPEPGGHCITTPPTDKILTPRWIVTPPKQFYLAAGNLVLTCSSLMSAYFWQF